MTGYMTNRDRRGRRIALGVATFVVALFSHATGAWAQNLTVDLTGSGAGTVVSSPAGLTTPCTGTGVTCVGTFAPSTTVTLTATATTGHTFGGWSGACTGAATCVVTLPATGGLLVAATFHGPPSYVFYHHDAIGSVRARTDSVGATLSRHDFDPFGGESVAVTTDQIGFGGKELDGATAQHYFGARYYRNLYGRFTTVDPVMDLDQAIGDPQRWNRYAYALNNPMKFVDPDGKSPIAALIVAAIAAGLLAPDTANAPAPGDPIYAGSGEGGVIASVATYLGGEVLGAKAAGLVSRWWGVAAGRAAGRLTTGSDEAVFWSGLGEDGMDIAAGWAGRNGGATLESTAAARGVRLPAFDASNPASVAVWREASREFAATARGNVRVLQSRAVNRNSIWAEVEFPALKANRNVTSITAIDPETGLEVILWSR